MSIIIFIFVLTKPNKYGTDKQKKGLPWDNGVCP